MIHLLLASLLWAFSFGLIKGRLAGLDPVLISLIRLALAALSFAPILFRNQLSRSRVLPVLALGALQFGVMYVLYIASFQYLPAWMVALFTVMTPLYVLLLAGIRERKLALRYLAAVALAIAGGAVVLARGLPAGASWQGIALLQGANLSFAAGQVMYPDLKRRCGANDGPMMAWMYLGAVLVPAGFLLVKGGVQGELPAKGQLAVLLYLGLVPTALGFYLWNKGATRVRPAFLASINNLKIPLAVLVSWIVFAEKTDFPRALLGLALVVAALFIAGWRDSNKNHEAD